MRPIYTVVENVLTPEECDRIIEVQGQLLEDACFNNQDTLLIPSLKRKSKVSWVAEGSELEPIMRKLVWILTDVAKSKHDADINWVEPIQYAEYPILGRYGYHFDVSPVGEHHRLISASVELSDSVSYIGGGLSFDLENVKNPPKLKGSMIIFPSMLKHSAKTVWYGKRRSLVLWGHKKMPFAQEAGQHELERVN